MLFTLGSFTFEQDDLPDTLTVGYQLKNTVVRLSDGSRFLQTFGAESDDLTFAGTFRYGDAVARAKQLETLFLARDPLPFDCDFVHRTILITKYQYIVKWQSEVDYSLTLYVSEDIPYSLQDIRLANTAANWAAAQVATNNVAVVGTSGLVSTLNTQLRQAGLLP